jgi:hypothetical protein
LRLQVAVTTETDFGVSTPVTAVGGVTTGALAPVAPLPHPEIDPNATALNSAHATSFFMLELPAGLIEQARGAFHRRALQAIDQRMVV